MKVGIVGAGVVGQLLALKLKIKNNDFNISLFDKSDGFSSCSYMSAGMLSPFCELNSSEKIIANLGAESIELWKKDIKLIEKFSNKKIFFQQNGTLVIAHRQDLEELKIFKRNIDRKIDANNSGNSEYIRHFARLSSHPDANQDLVGSFNNAEILDRARNDGDFLTEEIPYKILNQSEIKEKEPYLEDKFSQGLFFEKDGQVDPRSFLSSISEGLKNIGVKINFNNEAKITKNHINDKEFDLIFDCRGLGAAKDLSEKFNEKLRGVRGEIIVLQMSEHNKIQLNSSIRLIHPRFPLYISPREDNKFIVGATMIESEDMSPISVRSSLELLTAAFSINSQFGEARILEQNVQLRPTFENNLPKILYDGSRHFAINGLYRHGFLLSPKIVDLAINFALDGEVDEEYKEIFI